MPRGEGLPPLHPQALSQFYLINSGDFRRHFVIDPARILCVAGYFRCIGDSFPVHVSPATFLVALASVFTFSIYSPSFQLGTSARFLPRRGAVARARRASAARNADRAGKRRSVGDERESDWTLAGVFNPIPFHTSDGWADKTISATQK